MYVTGLICCGNRNRFSNNFPGMSGRSATLLNRGHRDVVIASHFLALSKFVSAADTNPSEVRAHSSLRPLPSPRANPARWNMKSAASPLRAD